MFHDHDTLCIKMSAKFACAVKFLVWAIARYLPSNLKPNFALRLWGHTTRAETDALPRPEEKQHAAPPEEYRPTLGTSTPSTDAARRSTVGDRPKLGTSHYTSGNRNRKNQVPRRVPESTMTHSNIRRAPRITWLAAAANPGRRIRYNVLSTELA